MTRNDIFGTEVKVGDKVAINPPRYKGLVLGYIVKFTPKGFSVAYRHQGREVTTTVFDVARRSYELSNGEYREDLHG